MELSVEQIKQINGYLYVCGIKWYDVREEMADHFASILEVKLAKNPNIDFKKEIIKIHKNFSNTGFKEFIQSKEKAVNKKFYITLLHHLKTFFKLPKVIISVGLFYGLLFVMNLFDNKETFFNYIYGFSFLLIIQLLIRVKGNHSEKKYLLLDRTKNFLGLTYALFYIGMIQTGTYRSSESFQNQIHNTIVLGFFVLFLFIYWSGEYVYFQNKKDIEKQYPNLIV